MPRPNKLNRMPEYAKPQYNEGICIFYEKKQKTDKYGTPIKGHELTEVRKEWYRILAVTSEENFHARSLKTNIDLRIGVKWFPTISSRFVVMLKNKEYEIFRIYQNSKRNETEISLTEV